VGETDIEGILRMMPSIVGGKKINREPSKLELSHYRGSPHLPVKPLQKK
jgi:hypothetical protein